MSGERFSRLYVQPESRAQDSSRARYRIGTLFGEQIFSRQAEQLAAYITRELGVPIPGGGRHSADWQKFVRECGTPELLDTVTVVYRYLFWHLGDQIANWWRDVVKQIFAEEHLAYEIDDAGGIHPSVDGEFQRNLTTAVAGLKSPRHQDIRKQLDEVAKYLSADAPNYKHAWRAMLSALEGVFALMFPYAQITGDEIDRRLLPVVQRAYEGDVTAQQAAQRLLNGLKEWVEASRHYRHVPGAKELDQPPADIAILAISEGASLLRWLAGLDEG
jgi:hypothetical protein